MDLPPFEILYFVEEDVRISATVHPCGLAIEVDERFKSEIVVERVVDRDIRYLFRGDASVEKGPDGVVNQDRFSDSPGSHEYDGPSHPEFGDQRKEESEIGTGG